jgi:predicted RNA-binding protein with TRAM domain
VQPDLKRGFIVFLDDTVSSITCIEVYKIGENFAFARPHSNTN